MALYLVREMSQQYKTKDPFVLAAHYNGGFTNGKAMQKNGKPKATETINYVNRVKDFINTGKYKNYTGNNVSTSMGMDGSSYDFAYEVKSLGELIASNDAAYGVNPLYPADLQPRDRTREASRQQIENMADDLKPEWLGESAKLSDGAPIIGVDNALLNRAMVVHWQSIVLMKQARPTTIELILKNMLLKKVGIFQALIDLF